MSGPGDEMAAGRGRLRASQADREQVIDLLKAAFVQGRLTRDELEARVAQALAPQTYAELAAVTADLPVELIAAERPVRPARARVPVNMAVRSGARLIGAGTTLAACAWTAAWLTGSTALFTLAVAFTVAYLGTLLLAGAVMLESREERRSSGRLPPGPRGGGRASRHRAPAGPLRQTDHGQHDSWAVRSPSPRPARYWRPGGHRFAPGS